MSYEYIKKYYGVDPKVGSRVQHEVTRKFGKITRENLSSSHYVMVKFEGGKHSLPCHPLELGLPALSSQKSAPERARSLPSGEIDPLVMSDSAGADTALSSQDRA